MPHNWASAECVRYLRHMLLLEDGQRMRLLEGMVSPNLRERKPIRLENTPTRFGRVTLQLEPLNKQGWRLDFDIESAQSAETVELPASLSGHGFDRLANAKFKVQGRRVMIDPSARKWTAF